MRLSEEERQEEERGMNSEKKGKEDHQDFRKNGEENTQRVNEGTNQTGNIHKQLD